MNREIVQGRQFCHTRDMHIVLRGITPDETLVVGLSVVSAVYRLHSEVVGLPAIHSVWEEVGCQVLHPMCYND